MGRSKLLGAVLISARRGRQIRIHGVSDKPGNPIVDEAIRHPFLERDEEIELVRRAGDGDGEAVRRLVGSHLRFVIKIARRYRGLGVPMSDLIQDGTVGLMQAVRRFDPRRGVRLSTYAMWWIRASLQASVSKSWSRVVAGSSNAQKALSQGLRRLAPQFGAESDSGGRGEEARSLLENLVCDAPNPEQRIAEERGQRVLQRSLAAALDRLPPREQLVIRKRYLEEVRPTFAAIGRELGVSKDRVRQLEGSALGRLRALLNPCLPNLR